MAKLTTSDVAEATAKALSALHRAVGQGDHSAAVDEAVATLAPPDEDGENGDSSEDESE